MKGPDMEEKTDETPILISQLREKLTGLSGKKYWKSLEELSETDEFRRFVHHEFSQEPSLWDRPATRRTFLKLMGSMIMMAGFAGCARQPDEKIVPYVKAPEDLIPGRPLYFATAMSLSGTVRGLLVESHMGRPTKVEGNPEHPASLGATDIFAQASVCELYDPDRSQILRKKGRIASWDGFVKEVRYEMNRQKKTGGAGLRILTETVTSPTLAHQITQLLRSYPAAKWIQYEPVNTENRIRGIEMVFGERLEARYELRKADVILALDSDFLSWGPGHLRYTRDFADRRRSGEEGRMNRLYAVENAPTNTGASADHRLAIPAMRIEHFARALAARLGVKVEKNEFYRPDENERRWIDAVAADLKEHRGSSLVLAGDSQPAEVHAVVHALNHSLGNTGKTVLYSPPAGFGHSYPSDALRTLVADMAEGSVDTLFVLGGNPLFNAPADLDFGGKIQKVRWSTHLGLYRNETAKACLWHVPEAHFLESWSDARAFDGSVSLIQPLIAPLYGGKSSHELLALMAGREKPTAHGVVQAFWKEQRPLLDFESFWQRTLHNGVMEKSAFQHRGVSPKGGPRIPLSRSGVGKQEKGDLELTLRPDPTVWDGRFANNGWLQELPKPLTKLTWDNAALIAPALAERVGLKNGDVVELKLDGRVLDAPVWILPGHADGSVSLHFGYGSKNAGRIGTGTGFNAYALRLSESPWMAGGLRLRRTGRRYKLVSTQDHYSMENRHLIRTATLQEFRANPEFAQEFSHDPKPRETLFRPEDHAAEGYAWGMFVDLNTCTGCNACITACDVENNISVVGKDEVANGREMHWIRVDRYFEGSLDQPEIVHQPVLCMHCENAPCEPVCPVGATTHSSEGLNEMVYNRCVGTRYCSNNCPYKVRRFNFYKYADHNTASLKLLRNPDVTVRSRGVMEKCTYCVQRINAARIDSKNEDRKIRDGEIVTACQAACPAQAIMFGDINDPNSRVTKLKASSRNYGLLTDLGTRPRTTYGARLTNPNPRLEKGGRA